MRKNNLFFVDSKIDRFSFSSYNRLISRLPRVTRYISYIGINKTLKRTIKKNYSGSIFRPINFELLTTFYTVIMLGSVSRAAKQLLITQPSVSLSLRKIEKETGLLLFKYLTIKKQTLLTPYGSILFNHIDRLFNIIEESLEFSKANFSSKFNNNNNLFQLKSENFTLRYARRKRVIFNYFLKNNFINFNKHKFSYFENESRFVFKKETYIKFNKFYTLNFKDSSDISLLFDKIYSFKNFNNKMLSSFDNFNIIEIQTKIAFNTCLQMGISSFIYWGSEV